MRILLALLCLAATPQALASPPLGRLFHTAEQRAELDRLRLRDGASLPAAAQGPTTLNGRVERSDGHGTAWINGVPVESQTASRQLAGPLKPGQTRLGDGSPPQDLLNGGSITVRRGERHP